MDQIKQFSNSDAKTFWAQLADWLISPPASVQEVGARRRAQLLATMSLSIGILNTVGILTTPPDKLSRVASLIILSALLFFAYGLSRTKFHDIGSWLVVIAISISAYYLAIVPDADTQAVLLTFMPLAFALGLGLLSQIGLGILVGASTFMTFLLPMFFPAVSRSDVVGSGGVLMTLGLLLIIVNAVQISVEKTRREDLLNANKELQALQGGLEQRVAERTKALETSAEVSRRLAAILDPNELAGAVVNQIQSAFDYYYAQIYLFDDAGENLVLTAGTGEAGAEMMKRGHRLPKGRGLVGRAAEGNESVLVSDTSQDPDWLPNQLLPDTKSEAAIPIAIGERVLGVLDVQDNLTNDITSEDITLLESLASQVAISLQNADSYARAESALQEAQSLVENAAEGIAVLDLTTGLFTSSNLAAEKIYGLLHDELMKVGPAQMSPPTQPDGRDSTEAVMEQIGIAMQKGSTAFDWVHINGQGDAFPCEIHLVRMPGDHPRLRVTVTDITERKSLQELTALRARQQEAINTITQRIQSASTIEEAMQVAARELGHAVGNRQTLVALEPSALGGNGKTTVNE